MLCILGESIYLDRDDNISVKRLLESFVQLLSDIHIIKEIHKYNATQPKSIEIEEAILIKLSRFAL